MGEVGADLFHILCHFQSKDIISGFYARIFSIISSSFHLIVRWFLEDMTTILSWVYYFFCHLALWSEIFGRVSFLYLTTKHFSHMTFATIFYTNVYLILTDIFQISISLNHISAYRISQESDHNLHFFSIIFFTILEHILF